MSKKPRYSQKYLDYLTSPEWKQKRVEVLKRCNNRCERCGSAKKISIHHKHYRTLGKESLNDLIALCSYCHPIADWERNHEVRILPPSDKGRNAPWPSKKKLKKMYRDSVRAEYLDKRNFKIFKGTG